ncbi:alcohol dehydrogenase [acceptor]-like isoform X1 [Dermacentor andersoni]|uniref:alcohol dehydrogenase [acceptor]-like isoform X1 n=1 Tax=Dermacentor andersoni TaxID=34620 RepID=UPI0021551199|nr:alcohol dehydrogenase [acceptor]-like isoform X1 [Dermacentor andersoni]XP_054918141.1 alcohol dehydrogenase [acceptor]-like isoform X1 [Dermacentor andersoni]
MRFGKKELVALNLVCIATAVLWHHLRRCQDIRMPPDPEYDYIVVGAGTAGSVLARRLLDGAVGVDGSPAQVLLVEAGRGEAPWYASVPLLSLALQATSIDWHFVTAPQKDALQCYYNQSLRWPRGKALGGSSNLYCMIHSRPTTEDWEEWNRRCKTCGFRAERVAALYRKLEFPVGDGHADRTPDAKIPVTDNTCSTSEICSALRQAAEHIGLGLEKEENQMQQSNLYKGRKWTTYDLYIKPALNNPRLRIMTGAHVSKVLFENTTAVGVEVISDGVVYQVAAKREVIISSGVVGSPHILLLSGIGPRDVLDEFRIPVINELPGVGRNLQEHITVPIYVNLKAPVSINEYKIKSLWQIWKYIWGGGHLASSAVASVLRTNVNDRSLQAMFVAVNFGSFREDVLARISNLKKEDMDALFPDIGKDDKEGFLLLATCLHPKSKGRISLNTGNALDPPNIDPLYFSDTHDLHCLTNAMKTALALVSDKAMSHLGASAHLPKLQYCNQLEVSAENNDFLECWARAAAGSLHHPVGTAAMGDSSDPSAVIDGHFRVRGMERLRVVDASVISFALSSTPHSVVMLLAERAAEIISSS